MDPPPSKAELPHSRPSMHPEMHESVHDEESNDDNERWYTDRDGVVFSYPPPKSAGDAWCRMFRGRVVHNSKLFDKVISDVRRRLMERLAATTVLQREIDEAMGDYANLFLEISICFWINV